MHYLTGVQDFLVVKRSCKMCLFFLDPAPRIWQQCRSHSLAWRLESSRKCHDLLHEGVTLKKWPSVKVLLAWSADVAEAASLYRNSDIFSCSDALTIKPSTGKNDIIVIELMNVISDVLFISLTQLQITNCSRISFSLY